MFIAFLEKVSFFETWAKLMDNEWFRVMISFAIRQILRWLQL